MDFARLPFWRIQDEDSRATFDSEGNIVSGSDDDVTFDCKGWDEWQDLGDAMERHLDWSNREDTPFISVYGDMAYRDGWAELEARRRVHAGKKKVTLIKIVLEDGMDVQFRRVGPLMEEKLRRRIPPQAEHMAEYEFVFLHCIPAEAIVELIEFS